jgi:hypothetical protein
MTAKKKRNLFAIKYYITYYTHSKKNVLLKNPICFLANSPYLAGEHPHLHEFSLRHQGLVNINQLTIHWLGETTQDTRLI